MAPATTTLPTTPLTPVPDPALADYLVDGYKPESFPAPIAFDSDTPAGLFANYLQHPCSQWHGIPFGIQVDEVVPETPTEGIGSGPTSGGLSGTGGGGSGATPITMNKPDDKISKQKGGKADGSEGSDLRNNLYKSTHDLPEDASEVKKIDEEPDLYEYPYSFIELTNRFVIDNGWTQIPIADTDPEAPKTASLIQLHGRTAKRILTMVASRDGKPPQIPSLKEDQKDENGHREVLARWELFSKAPTLSIDGTGRRYEIKVEFVYLMEKAPSNSEKLRGLSSQLDKFSPDNHGLDLGEIADTGGHLQWEDGVTTHYSGPPSSP